MQLQCEQCGAPFRAADLHLERGLATCSACGGVQQLPERSTPVAPDSSSSPVHKPRGDVPIPPRFHIDETGHELTIQYRWFTPGLFFLLFFVIGWDSFLVFWYSMAFGDRGPPDPMRWIMILFPICHVAVGVGLTYLVLAGFLNSSVVRVADGLLMIQHGPLPWKGNWRIPVDDIEQVFCVRDMQRDSDGDSVTRNEVHAVVGERQIKLLSGLHDAQSALFVEQRLERFLRIEDRPVPGEMVRE